MGTTIFDLIAVLFSDILKFNQVGSENSMSEEKVDLLEKKVNDLLKNKIFENKSQIDGEMYVNSQVFNDIISYCREENDFLLYRSILCQLDSAINIDILISKYDFNKSDDGLSPRTFEKVNTNSEDTGITIIPRVSTLADTFFTGTEHKKYKNANYWYDNINDHFNNIICIQNSTLDNYTIKNIIIDLFKNRERDKIVIGVTPICNSSLKELMKVNEYCNEETGKQHFAVEKYYNPEFLTERFLNALDLAKKKNVDILMGPEMLGSLKLCEPDEFDFNHCFRDENGQAPHIIVTPSFWYDGKNYISVYSKTGELIGKQYKQYCFEFTDEGKRYEEDLKDIPKEILLIHVPGWGRISFPICVDYLVAKYRDLLVRDLKSNIVLCPSYSTGTVQFGNASGAIREFGCRLVWLNSCSALKKFSRSPKAVGTVTAPITSPDDLVASSKTIAPECDGNCRECCLFTITIQAKNDKDKHCNDIEIIHVPL